MSTLACSEPRTTDIWWLDSKIFTAQNYILFCTMYENHSFLQKKMTQKCKITDKGYNTVTKFEYTLLHTSLQSLTGSIQGRITYREIPVVITGNRYAEYNFCLFWLHFFPCFNNIEIVALVSVMCTGNWKIILQGLKGCFDTL